MLTKSRKMIFAILIVAAFSMFAMVFAKSNTKANAEEDYDTAVTVEFSSVKYNVSNDGTQTLLVAAMDVSDITRVYELGFKAYDGDDPVALSPIAKNADANYYETHYFTSVNGADSEDLFGSAGKNLIVWKIETPEENVSYAPYIKYGYHKTVGLEEQLWSYGTERDVESPTKKAVTCYTVTIDPDEGTCATASVTVPSGTPASALNGITVTKTGYHYDNVWQAYNALGDSWSDISGSTLVTGDVTVRPKWVANTYTVNFVTDGGTAIANQTVDYGSTALRPDDPTKAGYKFVCWDTLFSTEITANTTFTAIWTVTQAYGDYTLSFINKYSIYEYPNANNCDAFTNAVVNDKLVTTTTHSIGNARTSGQGPALTIGGLDAGKMYSIDITFTTSGGILCFYNSGEFGSSFPSGKNVNNSTFTATVVVTADANGEAVWQNWYGVENLTITWDNIAVSAYATYGDLEVGIINTYSGDAFTSSVVNDKLTVTTTTGKFGQSRAVGPQFKIYGLDASSSYTVTLTISVTSTRDGDAYLVYYYETETAKPKIDIISNSLGSTTTKTKAFTTTTDENGVLTWRGFYGSDSAIIVFDSITVEKN